MLTTRTLSASAALTDPAGNILSGVTISFTLVDTSLRPISVWDAISGDLIVGSPSVVTDVNGLFSINLWPTARGNMPCQYLCKVNYPNITPFTFSISDLATPLSWVDAMASGQPLTPQQLAFYDGITAAAQVSANAAAGSATTATTQAGIATTQAAIATAQAGTATTQAAAAAGSAASLTAALQQFNALYLGKKAADPTVDNNGAALVVGAEYFNTTTNVIRVYGSAGWTNLDTVDVLNAALSATNAAASAGASALSEIAAASSAAVAALAAAHAMVPSQSLKTDYTVLPADMGTLIMFTGPVTVTFPTPTSTFASAVPVIIANINLPAITLAGLPASLGVSSLAYGEVAAFLCDGTNWYRLGSDPHERGDLLKGSGIGVGVTSLILTTDGNAASANNQIVPLANSSFYVRGSAVVRQASSATQNQVACAIDFWAAGYIGSTPGSIVIVSSGATNQTATTGWTVNVTPDTTNGAIQVEFSSGSTALAAYTTVTATCGTRMAQ